MLGFSNNALSIDEDDDIFAENPIEANIDDDFLDNEIEDQSSNAASVQFMITRKMQAKLINELGYLPTEVTIILLFATCTLNLKF